jgi:hypothetical protein
MRIFWLMTLLCVVGASTARAGLPSVAMEVAPLKPQTGDTLTLTVWGEAGPPAQQTGTGRQPVPSDALRINLVEGKRTWLLPILDRVPDVDGLQRLKTRLPQTLVPGRYDLSLDYHGQAVATTQLDIHPRTTFPYEHPDMWESWTAAGKPLPKIVELSVPQALPQATIGIRFSGSLSGLNSGQINVLFGNVPAKVRILNAGEPSELEVEAPSVPVPEKVNFVRLQIGAWESGPYPFQLLPELSPDPRSKSLQEEFLELSAAAKATIALSALSILSVLVGFFTLARRRAKAYEKQLHHLRALQETLEQQQASPLATPRVRTWEAFPKESGVRPPPAPEIPKELIEACASGECVLYAAGNLGAQSGYPLWKNFIRLLLERMGEPGNPRGGLSELETRELHVAFERGDYHLVSEVIRTRVGQDTLAQWAREVFQSPRPLSKMHTALRDVGFASVISSGWDQLWETAFPQALRVLSPRNSESWMGSFRNAPFYLVKTWGDPTEPGSFIFSQEEYLKLLREHSTFSKFISSLIASKTVLFVGASEAEVVAFFENFQPPRNEQRKHFALIAEDVTKLRKDLLWSKHGVELLPFQATPGYPQLEEFAEKLRTAVQRRRATTSPPRQLQPMKLTQVRLHNIGPYSELTLSLEAGWNVILGNNGCGKSTLLKAIALGLCGDDPSVASAAKRLLASHQQEGCIELRVGTEVYRTDLFREGNSVRVSTKGFTPLQKGNWLTLGFPPLRGISLRGAQGPSNISAPTPVVEDLLPLLSGTTDTRLDTLKQWIINQDVLAKRGKDVVLARFFSLLGDLSPGVPFTFERVEEGSWEVMVKTPDGVIPLDLVSQGTSSVLGWAGSLIQRMFEVHASSEAPQREPALLLVDEIDAHLHPEWQQRLIPLVAKHFPNLQIIATTHSPLLIAGMEQREVFIARRAEDGPVTIEPSPQDPRGLRADQILTSPLFGLSHTRNKAQVDRYIELARRQLRHTPEERQEFERLREALGGSSGAETQTEQAVEKAVKLAFGPASSNELLPEEAQLEIRRQLERIFPRTERKP